MIGDTVVYDGGEIVLNNLIGGEITLGEKIDGGEIGTTTIVPGRLEAVEVTPQSEDVLVSPSEGYRGLSSVLVKAIPQNYGRVTYNGSTLTIT